MKKDLRISELCDVYGELLTTRQKDIINSYYDYDLSLAEISENYGITRQAVRDAIVKASEQLENYENVVGALSYKEKVKNDLQELLALLDGDKVEEAKEILLRLYKI